MTNVLEKGKNKIMEKGFLQKPRKIQGRRLIVPWTPPTLKGTIHVILSDLQSILRKCQIHNDTLRPFSEIKNTRKVSIIFS